LSNLDLTTIVVTKKLMCGIVMIRKLDS